MGAYFVALGDCEVYLGSRMRGLCCCGSFGRKFGFSVEPWVEWEEAPDERAACQRSLPSSIGANDSYASWIPDPDSRDDDVDGVGDGEGS